MNNDFNNQDTFDVQPPEPAAEAPAKPILILIFGIISVALAGIVGLIFAIITKKKVKAYEEYYGEITDTKVKIGKILCTIGLILSIVAIVAYVILALIYGGAIIAAIGLGAASSSYYYY